MAAVDVDTLPLTQYLVLEVLAARYRDPVDQLAGHGEGHCEPADYSGEATA